MAAQKILSIKGLDSTFWKQFSGLSPAGTIIVGTGFVREEIKAKILEANGSLTASALFGQIEFLEFCIKRAKGIAPTVLGSRARVELLKKLFRSSAVRDQFPEWSIKRNRPQFFESLDINLQRGRMLFSHQEEAEVIEDRLQEMLGLEEHRAAYFRLNRIWDELLDKLGFYDEPRLYEIASQINLPEGLGEIYFFRHEILKPREKFYFEGLEKKTEFNWIKSDSTDESPERDVVTIRKTHSFEDALWFLFDEILVDLNNDKSTSLVIEDRPEIRRAVLRMARQKGIQWFDPRDPGKVRLDERIKQDELEFELVAKDFPLDLVLQWVSLFCASLNEVRTALLNTAYSGKLEFQGSARDRQVLAPLKKQLEVLKARWLGIRQDQDRGRHHHHSPSVKKLPISSPSRRKNIQELSEIFLGSQQVLESPYFLFWKSFFESWANELSLVQSEDVRKPLRIWYEEFKAELRLAKPPTIPYKVKGGLALYRVDQAVSFSLLEKNDSRLHFFGVSESFFQGREWSNEWLSQRELECLGQEFGMVTLEEIQADRVERFKSWVKAGASVLWQYEYDQKGGIASEEGYYESQFLEGELLIESLGVHPRLKESFAGNIAKLPRDLRIDSLAVGDSDLKLSMTRVHQYSQCPFIAYAAMIGAYDEREASYELRGEVYGNLLHSALEDWVRLLHTTALEISDLNKKAERVFQVAWEKTLKKGWVQSPRIFRSLQVKVVELLIEFASQDLEYREKSGAHFYFLERDRSLKLSRGKVVLEGHPDRIDVHEDGFVVIDYKTQRNLPSGKQILEHGNGLQLGLYALAAKETLLEQQGQSVIGGMYIQLGSRKITRNTGIFFDRWNGKKAKKPLSSLRANSHSLILDEPEAAWEKVEEHLARVLAGIQTGDYSARPAIAKNCEGCRWKLACGEARRELGEPLAIESESEE